MYLQDPKYLIVIRKQKSKIFNSVPLRPYLSNLVHVAYKIKLNWPKANIKILTLQTDLV